MNTAVSMNEWKAEVAWTGLVLVPDEPHEGDHTIAHMPYLGYQIDEKWPTQDKVIQALQKTGRNGHVVLFDTQTQKVLETFCYSDNDLVQIDEDEFIEKCGLLPMHFVVAQSSRVLKGHY